MGARFRLGSGDSLVVATHNQGKLREFRDLFDPLGIAVASSGELGVSEPEETGSNLRGECAPQGRSDGCRNGAARACGRLRVSPSRLSPARPAFIPRAGPESREIFIGPCPRLRTNCKPWAQSPQSSAGRSSFACSALQIREGAVQFFEGTVPGHLVWPPRGTKGFGYDPMFVPDGYDVTFGEMDPDKKHAISHRARAFAAFRAAVLDGGSGNEGRFGGRECAGNLYSLAILPVEMPVLRLQLLCAANDKRRAVPGGRAPRA